MTTRELIHKAFRRPDLSEADVHEIVDFLLEPPALKALRREVQDIKVSLGVMRWVVGFLTAAMFGVFWMLIRIHERLGAIEATLRLLAERV